MFVYRENEIASSVSIKFETSSQRQLRALLYTARNHPLRFAMADAQNPRVSFGAALVRSVFLARRLRKIWSGQTMAGVLLPPSVPGALVNHAALLLGVRTGCR